MGAEVGGALRGLEQVETETTKRSRLLLSYSCGLSTRPLSHGNTLPLLGWPLMSDFRPQ